MVTQQPPSILRRLWTWLSEPVDYGARGYVTGAADVAPWESAWGVGSSPWQPDDLVSYLSKSNGVQACVNARVNALTSLPIVLYSKRKDASGKRKVIETGPARDLLDTINPYWTFERWVEMTEQALCIWGKSFSFYTLKGGKPVEMWWVPADRVKVHPHPTEYVSHFTYDPGKGAKPIRFERNETLWIRRANIANQYDGLSPLMSSLLSADSAIAAMKSNYLIFQNGLTAAGMVSPGTGSTGLTEEQAKAVATDLTKRFKGVDNAHKVAVLRFPVDVKQLSMTPKDAQFMDMMNLSLEDIARAYVVPIDKVGGKRTYQNVQDSERVFWTDCIIPEARFIAAEITEQLLTLFGGDLVAEFDDSDVDVLHEAESAKWQRWKEQLETGARIIDEYRDAEGLPKLPHGGDWWAPATLVPIGGPMAEEAAAKAEEMAKQFAANDDQNPAGEGDATPNEPAGTDAERGRSTRAIAYGSPEHQERWARQIANAEPWEADIANATVRLLRDQQQSVLAQLRERRRSAEAASLDPFDRSRWIKSFRITLRPIIAGVVEDAAAFAEDELGFSFGFDVQDPNVLQAIEQQVQRFAEEVNQTTWDDLRREIGTGVNDGESIDQIADRIEAVMGSRMRSAKETIARTETTVASTNGTLASWSQSGVVARKRWLAAIDDRTRESHIHAHGQEVGIDEDFQVGAGSGPGPGMIGKASEDINCRCSMEPVLDVEV